MSILSGLGNAYSSQEHTEEIPVELLVLNTCLILQRIRFSEMVILSLRIQYETQQTPVGISRICVSQNPSALLARSLIDGCTKAYLYWILTWVL